MATTSSRASAASSRRALCLWFALSLFGAPAGGEARTCGAGPPDLTALSIEELMAVEVTSVSKKPQRLDRTAAAVFVITAEDIRRSGAKHLPEILRMAPGVHVARIDANKWAVSIRGFNGRYSSKLLVLMDGRSLYNPLFSGVYWEAHDYILEDIERIEVIRGPGGSVWGANAFNGIINIITKSAKETTGGLAGVGFGEKERALGALRYGGEINDATWYRLYAKYSRIDGGESTDGRALNDGWESFRAGFRLDGERERCRFSLHGTFFYNDLGSTLTPVSWMLFPGPREIVDVGNNASGTSLLGKWEHRASSRSSFSLQTYYDRHRWEEFDALEVRDTVDIEVQHRFPATFPAGRHDIQWGLGYRLTTDEITASEFVSFEPDRRTDHLFSLFFQDEVEIVKDALWLTAGAKIEHNDYTGFEFQPSLQCLWSATPRHAFWFSAAKAVRTPSRFEHDGTLAKLLALPGDNGPLFASLVNNEGFDSEIVRAFEAGYRFFASDRLSLDIAAFFNQHEHLRAFVQTGFPDLSLNNDIDVDSRGIEVSADYSISDRWRIKAAFTETVHDIYWKNTSGLAGDRTSQEYENPERVVSIRSQFDLRPDLECDLWLRHTAELSGIEVPGYTTLDVRLAWRPTDRLTFELVGKNLLDDRHPEFSNELEKIVAAEVERRLFGYATWRF